MPYFGKTKYAYAEKKSKRSAAVYDIGASSKEDPIAIAVKTPVQEELIESTFTFVFDGNLLESYGVIEFCQTVERLPASQGTGFSKSFTEILDEMQRTEPIHALEWLATRRTKMTNEQKFQLDPEAYEKFLDRQREALENTVEKQEAAGQEES